MKPYLNPDKEQDVSRRKIHMFQGVQHALVCRLFVHLWNLGQTNPEKVSRKSEDGMVMSHESWWFSNLQQSALPAHSPWILQTSLNLFKLSSGCQNTCCGDRSQNHSTSAFISPAFPASSLSAGSWVAARLLSTAMEKLCFTWKQQEGAESMQPEHCCKKVSSFHEMHQTQTPQTYAKWHHGAAGRSPGKCFGCLPADSRNTQSILARPHSKLSPLWSMSKRRHELCPPRPWGRWEMSPAWLASVLKIQSTKILRITGTVGTVIHNHQKQLYISGIRLWRTVTRTHTHIAWTTGQCRACCGSWFSPGSSYSMCFLKS